MKWSLNFRKETPSLDDSVESLQALENDVR